MAFRNLRVTIRSLLRKKVITAINILGLSIGISAALVIYLIVQYDYDFDRYEPNGSRTYRVATHGDNWDNAGVPVPLLRSLGNVTRTKRSLPPYASSRPKQNRLAGKEGRSGLSSI